MKPRQSGVALSGDRYSPFLERTPPEITIVVSPDQMPSQVEQVSNRSMGRGYAVGLF